MKVVNMFQENLVHVAVSSPEWKDSHFEVHEMLLTGGIDINSHDTTATLHCSSLFTTIDGNWWISFWNGEQISI